MQEVAQGSQILKEIIWKMFDIQTEEEYSTGVAYYAR